MDAPPRPVPPETSVLLSISGMSCGACAARIERSLNGLAGARARVNYATERARVEVPAGTSVQQVLDTVAATGYSAAVIDTAHPPIELTTEIDARVRSLRRRLIVSVLLLMPVCDLSLAFWLVPELRFPGWQWLVLLVAAPIVTWAAWPFYRAAVRGARHGTTSMDTLVSIGIAAATGWSIYAMFFLDTSHAPSTGSLLSHWRHLPGGAIYLEVAAGVTTFLLAGRYFEARSRRQSASALRSLANVAARDASVLSINGTEECVPADMLRVGDRFVVRPGETIAADGVVESGRSSVDQRAMTGESAPVETGAGDRVIGGTVSMDGRLIVRATAVGNETQLSEMLRLVEEAQNQKASVQRLADRISAIFVPVVLALAVCTLAGWLLTGHPAPLAFEASLSVLIIACPCALGLATPMALFVASGRGAQLGIFFKGHQGLEASRAIDTVLLDKTGTVTEGELSVLELRTRPGVDGAALLRWAGVIEGASEHLVARAIAKAAAEAAGGGGQLPDAEDFRSRPGLGAQALVEGHPVSVGSRRLMEADGLAIPTDLARQCRVWGEAGWSSVYVARDGEVVGALALADTPKPSAAAAVADLGALGLKCIVVTGDGELPAADVARQVGVTDVVAGVLPAQKVALVRRLQAEGHAVAMVGDGINDGPALAAADLGVAVGWGTDVAINAADLIILRQDLRTVATAIELSRRALRTIHGNLAWAFAYNVAAIPLAMLGLLNPLIAGAAMVLSSTFVVWNSSRLRRVGTTLAPVPSSHGTTLNAPAREPCPVVSAPV